MGTSLMWKTIWAACAWALNHKIMELLSYSNSTYLLNASLESLHAESREWLNEIEFLKDETAFFKKLILNRDTIDAFPPEELMLLNEELMNLTQVKLERMKLQVEDHEKLLANLINFNQLKHAESYRQTHRVLFIEMHDIISQIRTIKKKIFSFLQSK